MIFFTRSRLKAFARHATLMTADPTRVYLIDGSSYIFRAFFALPPLTNSSGLPTHAIYGFTSMMMKFLKEFRPEYVSVLLDAGRETFRNELFKEYKGNRPEAPPDLVPQFPYIRKVLDALNIAMLELEGYEADDLIGTLCHSLAPEDCEVVVVSGDKDLMQLVTDRVKMLDTAKNRWIGKPQVLEKFGVEPDKVVEVMGLMGDSIDNIPGVRGIGEKTATALIQRFHTLENLFDHLDELDTINLRGAARVRKALEQSKNEAFLSRQLATVKTDAPIDVPLNTLRFKGLVAEKLRPLFSELEFTNLLKLLDSDHS